MRYLMLVLWLSSTVLAQSFGAKPYLESSTPFLKSAYCQKYRCTLLSRVALQPQVLEELYRVKYPASSTNSLLERLVVFQSYAGKVGGIAFRYSGQDIPDQSKTILAEFVDFATGNRVTGESAYKVLETEKPLRFKGKNGLTYLVSSDSVPTLLEGARDFRFVVQQSQYSN